MDTTVSTTIYQTDLGTSSLPSDNYYTSDLPSSGEGNGGRDLFNSDINDENMLRASPGGNPLGVVPVSDGLGVLFLCLALYVFYLKIRKTLFRKLLK